MEAGNERILDGGSYNSVKERIETFKRLFPEAVSEGMLDYDTLMTLLGDEFDNEHEKYRFEWKGKLNALKLAQKRSTATLRPCKEESVDWDTTKNLYIEGDNLEVLKLLQQGYLRKVKMIYIDPPYNTGNDFVYEDDFADPIGKYRQITGQTLRANPETAGRYHSNWLNMMYPRLKIAKTLLRDDGVIFISIDDNEQHNLRKLCDEVFGEDNFIACLLWEKARKNDARFFSVGHEYIVVYARSEAILREHNVYWREDKPGAHDIFSEYQRLHSIHGDNFPAMEKELRAFYSQLPQDHPAKKHSRYNKVDDNGVWRDHDLSWPGGGGPDYDVIHPVTGLPCKVPTGGWRFPTLQRMQEMIDAGVVVFREDHTEPPIRKSYLVRKAGRLSDDGENVGKQVMGTYFYRSAIQATNMLEELIGKRLFDFPKDLEVLQRLISYVTDKDSIVLDFFSGSATTAHAIMQLNAEDNSNRRFIMVQMPEMTDEGSEAHKAGYRNICDIGKERIRRAGQKIRDEAGLLVGDLDTGFKVFKLDSSNLKQWDNSYIAADHQEKLFERMESMFTPAKPGRSDDDIIYEIFLKYGIELTETYAPLDIDGKRFYTVGESGDLFICLDKELTVETVERAVELKPKTMIFARDSFADTNAITNVAQVLEKFGVGFRWV